MALISGLKFKESWCFLSLCLLVLSILVRIGALNWTFSLLDCLCGTLPVVICCVYALLALDHVVLVAHVFALTYGAQVFVGLVA